MGRPFFQFCAIVILVLPGILGGCVGGTSQPSIYYVFNTALKHAAPPSRMGDRALGVGPVTIPAFLKRPQIVTRQGQNVLNINEFHRWGDSLEDQITTVLVETLSMVLNTPNVRAYPWERPFMPAVQLYVDFRRFDGTPAGSVVLDAVWWVVDTQSNTRLLTRRSSLVEKTQDDGYTAYVVALNTMLEKFSREMADGVIGVLPD